MTGTRNPLWVLRRAVLACTLLVALLPTGCTAHQPDGLVGSWSDARGQPVPDGSARFGGELTIRTFLARTGCDSGPEVVYLELAWPPGRVVDVQQQTQQDTRFFVRDGYYPDVPVPAPGTGSGPYRRAGNSIVFDSAGSPYVRRPDGRTERWPEVEVGCA